MADVELTEKDTILLPVVKLPLLTRSISLSVSSALPDKWKSAPGVIVNCAEIVPQKKRSKSNSIVFILIIFWLGPQTGYSF